MSRIKKTMAVLPDREAAEMALNELGLIESNRRRLAAEMDQEILDIKAAYQGQLSECELKVAELTDQLQAWAVANPQEFAKGAKSLAWPAGRLGFRTGMPKLALLNRSWTWAKVLDWVKSHFPRCVRTKDELDKEAVLSGHAGKLLSDADLATCGMKVVQDETFFVEPVLTEPTQ